jgi:hypothetical protein
VKLTLTVEAAMVAPVIGVDTEGSLRSALEDHLAPTSTRIGQSCGGIMWRGPAAPSRTHSGGTGSRSKRSSGVGCVWALSAAGRFWIGKV